MWAEAPAEVKSQFTEAAKREKEEHARLYVICEPHADKFTDVDSLQVPQLPLSARLPTHRHHSSKSNIIVIMTGD
jgi:hypothetical protein